MSKKSDHSVKSSLVRGRIVYHNYITTIYKILTKSSRKSHNISAVLKVGGEFIPNPVNSCLKCSGEACPRQGLHLHNFNGFDIIPVAEELPPLRRIGV